MKATIIEVDAPLGSGVCAVIEAGLKALGVRHTILMCDVLDVLDLDVYLANGDSAFILASVDRMRPDFRMEMMDRIESVDATFWILRSGRVELARIMGDFAPNANVFPDKHDGNICDALWSMCRAYGQHRLAEELTEVSNRMRAAQWDVFRGKAP